MKLQLSDGVIVVLRIEYGVRKGKVKTRITLEFERLAGLVDKLVGHSSMSKKQFFKPEARRQAAIKLLAAMRVSDFKFTKADRMEVFQACCYQFSPAAEERRALQNPRPLLQELGRYLGGVAYQLEKEKRGSEAATVSGYVRLIDKYLEPARENAAEPKGKTVAQS